MKLKHLFTFPTVGNEHSPSIAEPRRRIVIPQCNASEILDAEQPTHFSLRRLQVRGYDRILPKDTTLSFHKYACPWPMPSQDVLFDWQLGVHLIGGEKLTIHISRYYWSIYDG